MMSTDVDALSNSWTIMTYDKPYDQFLLFGDSITEQAGCQDRGFAFAAALQDGKYTLFIKTTTTRNEIPHFCSSSKINDLCISLTTLAPTQQTFFPSCDVSVKRC